MWKFVVIDYVFINYKILKACNFAYAKFLEKFKLLAKLQNLKSFA